MQLQERRADLSLGSFRQSSERNAVATSTINYFQTLWSVVTLSEAYILTSLETLLFPFTTNTWFLLAFVCFLALTTVTLIRTIFRKVLSKYIDHVSLDVLLMLLGMPALYTPRYNTTRILNASWMLFALILRTIYQALLFHLIRSNVTRNMPKNLFDLVQKNYSLIVDPPGIDALIDISLFRSLKFIISNDKLSWEYLENMPLKEAKYTAAAIPFIFLQYYIESLNKSGIFKMLPQSIMNFKMCMYVSKHSFLIEQFDDVLKLIRGFGFLQAWYRQEVNLNYFRGKHLNINHVFGLQQLKMAFILLVFGYMIAFMVFLMEFVFKALKKVKVLKLFKQFLK